MNKNFLWNGHGNRSLLVGLQKPPTGLDELVESPLGGSECEKIVWRHAVRLIGAYKFGHALQPLNNVWRHGAIDPFLTLEILR